MILFLSLIFNCFIKSETKATETLKELGHGEYYISSKQYLDEDMEYSFPIISGYDYLIISENSNDSNPLLIIDSDICIESNKYISTETDYFIEIELKNINCTTLVVAIKRK